MENNYHLIDHDYIVVPNNNNVAQVNHHLIDHKYILPFPNGDMLAPESVQSEEETDDNESEEELNGNEQVENPEPFVDAQVPVDVQPLYHLQRATTYTVAPGVRLNSEFIFDNLHYKYYKNKILNNKIYLVCQNRKNKSSEFCPCTAVISVNRNDNRITTFGQHNHLAPLLDIPMVHLRRNLGISGTSPALLTNSVRQLYNRDIVIHPEGARNYTFTQAENMILIMRRSRRPANPEIEYIPDRRICRYLSQPNFRSYASTLQHPSSDFFQQQFPFMAEEERVGVIFVNLAAIEKYREELATVRIAGVDGTFKTIPKCPPQFRKGCLLTFQIVLKHASFPMVYALTSRMNQATYESFFRIVQQILPLNYAELTILTDYERALMNAVKNIFPESQLQGCWFHYCQMDTMVELAKATTAAATAAATAATATAAAMKAFQKYNLMQWDGWWCGGDETTWSSGKSWSRSGTPKEKNQDSMPLLSKFWSF